MSNSGRGESKTLSTASNGQPSKKKDRKNNTNDKVNNVSFDDKSDSLSSNTSLDLDISFDKPASSLKELQQMFIQKLNLIQTGMQSQVDTLFNVVKMKDEIIGKLQADIGALKQSVNHISQDTSDNQNAIKECNKIMESKFAEANKYVETVKNKTVDLEDRSRRSNLVFFNFPEAADSQTEDCEQLVHNVLEKLDIMQDEEVWIERAHRLGRKQPGSDRPRPVIVKFTYFKQKQCIIKNASKFRKCPINVSEDFSKETLDIHRKLVNYGKHAKNSFEDPLKAIVHYKLIYRKLVLTYSLNKRDSNAKQITRYFSLDDISENAYWFLLKPITHDTTGRKNQDTIRNGYQPGHE